MDAVLVSRRITSSCTARHSMKKTGDFYHWHIEIIPKLTQVAGFEWGTGFHINPVAPEGRRNASGMPFYMVGFIAGIPLGPRSAGPAEEFSSLPLQLGARPV